MKKILVSDKASFTRVKMAKLLSDEGFDVIQAESGQKAVELYQSFLPDVILMDLFSQKEEDFTSIKKITEIDPQANVIMLSSIGQEPDLINAITTGAKDFIVKPINKNSLFFKIQNLLETIRV
ncbi:MAG: two-component system response regulator [Chloroflexi bacterium HGW-Chloroflexi-8]|jgi:two-component system chemotaxis response regulator CheY|nr:MAG: two-component system response regulator [Chloroflexi bacterium HGW-Chloroflexi-8]